MIDVADPPVRRTRQRVLVWIARMFLAAVFVFVGAIKLPDDARMWIRLFDSIGIGQWFRYVTGIVEVTAGLLMLWPAATPVAVLLAVGTMAGALTVHAAVTGFGSQTVAVAILLALSLWVGRSHIRARRTA
jgi:putative oxidoreductase